MKEPLCNFCKSNSYKLYEKKIEDFKIYIYRCENCGLMFQYPFPSPEDLKKMYDKEYYGGNKVCSYEDERKSFKYNSYVWKARLNKIKSYLKTDKPKILDIGCSFGGFLSFSKLMGFDPYGVEISDYSREYAQNELGKGRVFKNINGNFEKNFFDVITMIEVIEHLDNPLFFLNTCYDILKKDSVLVIQTADMNGLQARKAGIDYHYFIPYHLHFFPSKTLVNKLKEIGFKKIKVFRPVDFGLIPKLLKARRDFKSLKDYLRWFTISYYHFKGYIHFKNFALTSSMVVYAFK